MVSKPDPRVEKIKRRQARKEKRNMTRATFACAVAIVKLRIAGTPPNDLPSEECEHCLKLQARPAYRPYRVLLSTAAAKKTNPSAHGQNPF